MRHSSLFSPDLAEIRFGCGLSPVLDRPVSVAAMLAGLSGPDVMARAFPIPGYDAFRPRLVAFQALVRERALARRAGAGRARQEALLRQMRAARAEALRDMSFWAGQTVLRWVHSPTGLRERLVAFWADHFTTQGRRHLYRFGVSTYVEDAIRPHLGGAFADLLIAAVIHPVMLQFLDQDSSIGPDSPVAGRAKRRLGLNENLAREVLELHTLGVDGPYGQADVRALAELFTGLDIGPDAGFRFRPGIAQPGAETVLGRRYGGGPQLADIEAALRDLARHPATARHLARKLAVHFVADDPDPALVDHLAARYAETGGALDQVYAALLEHPAAWAPELRNVKPPFDFIASACRALALEPAQVLGREGRAVRGRILLPMALMGQRWQQPTGPDGLSESDGAWITPQGLSARLRWALSAPGRMRRDLPDPRAFVDQALGGYAPQSVRFAAGAAETRAEGVGLVLAAPAFQRR